MIKSEVRVMTPERVSLGLRLAGIGSRGIAQLIDLLVLLVFYAILGTGIAVWYRFHLFGVASSYMIGFGILFSFLIFWGYFIGFEALSSGKTIGKMVMKIRTVSDDGRPVSFLQAAVRNLLRIVDYFPSGYLVGIVCMLVDSKERRLGDMVAGTLVVADKTSWTLRFLDETESEMNHEESPHAIEPTSIYSLLKSDAALRIAGELPQQWESLLSSLYGRLKGMSREQRIRVSDKVLRELVSLPQVSLFRLSANEPNPTDGLRVEQIRTKDVLLLFRQLARTYRTKQR